MKAVVLGWDALDIERIESYGLGDAFGKHRKRIETYVNPVIDEPHTKELWPSMITGLHPADHGVHAVTASDRADWNSPVIDEASRLANGVVPKPILSYVGRQLRRRGIGLSAKSAGYYSKNGIETVFDDVGGKAISIPNYQTEADRRHGLDANRDELWSELDVDKSYDVGMGPRVSLDRTYHLLGREVGVRVGQTIQAIAAGNPLVWTWFGVLDSVGHMEPALGERIVRDWYHTAASLTEAVREIADEDTAVIAVSDHGLQDGTHTHYATICSDHAEPIEEIDHVFDVAGYLRSAGLSPADGQTDVDADGIRDVNETLEALGYK